MGAYQAESQPTAAVASSPVGISQQEAGPAGGGNHEKFEEELFAICRELGLDEAEQDKDKKGESGAPAAEACAPGSDEFGQALAARLLSAPEDGPSDDLWAELGDPTGSLTAA